MKSRVIRYKFFFTHILLFSLFIFPGLLFSQEFNDFDKENKFKGSFQINSYILKEINTKIGQFKVLDVLTNEIKTFNTHSFMGSMFVRQVKEDRVVFDSFEWLINKQESTEKKIEEESREEDEEEEETDEFDSFEELLFDSPAEEDESLDELNKQEEKK